MPNYRQVLLATVSVAALAATHSAAGAQTPPVANWSGFYVGIVAGAAQNQTTFSEIGDLGGNALRFPIGPYFSENDNAFMGGGLVGYNWQSGFIVYGIEGDFAWVDGKSSRLRNQIVARTEMKHAGTVRGRIGIAGPSTLFYFTAGVAVAHFNDVSGPIFTATPDFISSRTRTGFIFGGGIEQRLMGNWSVRLEGTFADFGSQIVPAAPGAPGAVIGPYRARFEHAVAMARSGFSFRW